MESDTTVLTLLSIVVLASGCITPNGGGETVTEGPESVIIQELRVEPTKIFSGQPVRASLTAVNAGNTEAEIIVGENGGDILDDHCTDIFDLESFSASSSRSSETQKSYTLQSGEKINARWTLQQQGNVPIYGKRCNLDFSVPFNYSVNTYRQIQIKRNREVSGSPKLSSESSSGPLVLAIDPIQGATGEENTYVLSENGDRRINVMLQLINPDPEEEFKKGLVNVDKNSFSVRATEPLQLNEKFEEGEWQPQGYSEPRCEMPDAELRMTRGKSVIINCEIPLDEKIDDPSVLSEISASVNYTYIKNAGGTEVEVKPRG